MSCQSVSSRRGWESRSRRAGVLVLRVTRRATRCWRALSACAHTESGNFPDPVKVNGSEGFPNTIGQPGGSSVSIEGITFRGPVFVAAEDACAAGGPAAQHGPRLSEVKKEAFIAQARCIREHGVPGFPDPTFGPAGCGIRSDLDPGENPASPAMRAAEKACASVGSPLPGV